MVQKTVSRSLCGISFSCEVKGTEQSEKPELPLLLTLAPQDYSEGPLLHRQGVGILQAFGHLVEA